MPPRFELIEIPQKLRPVIGKPDPGTRIFRTEGLEGESGAWFEAINAIAGTMVSPGGVSMFAPVSRAAVYKRLKEGRLTAFCFHTTVTKKGLFGKRTLIRETPYVYVPVDECKAWADEIKERMLRLGQVTADDLEGDKPDWSQDFWEWESKWRKQKLNNEEKGEYER